MMQSWIFPEKITRPLSPKIKAKRPISAGTALPRSFMALNAKSETSG